jgi:hypothetical protein
MGWSSVTMLKRYQHVTKMLRRNMAGRIGEFFWKDKWTKTETTGGAAQP